MSLQCHTRKITKKITLHLILKLKDNVQHDAVIKRYCRETVDGNGVRLVQFIRERIDYRDYYEADCQLSRKEICDIIEVLATE